MRARTKLAVAAGAVAVVLAAGVGAAIAAGGDDDTPLTGSALEHATAAALDHVGGGTVLETEAGDDGAAYGVEIRREDGTVVEVSLDADFEVVGTEADDDTAEGAEREDDD
jgi:uncharacterized membrane protein YkoI